MEERGVVVQLKDGNALIRAERSSACENCASKKSCSTGGAGNEMFIEAANPVNARVGDRVIFAVGAGSVLKAGVLLYLVPVISFIAGVVLGQLASPRFPDVNPDLIAGVTGAVFLLAAFMGLKIYSSKIDNKKSFRPQVLRVE